jgi:hypothetical protein
VGNDGHPRLESVVAKRNYPPPAGPEWAKAKRTGEARVSDEIMGGVWEGYTFPPFLER